MQRSGKPKSRARSRNKNASGRVAKKTLPVSVLAAPTQPVRVMGTDSGVRKRYPLTEGLLDYFPDACLEVSNVSFAGNQKHNPGEPMHHARGKSMDHANCIGRHLVERGGYDEFEINGVIYRIRHTAALAWRALALLQEELEHEANVTLPRAARP